MPAPRIGQRSKGNKRTEGKDSEHSENSVSLKPQRGRSALSRFGFEHPCRGDAFFVGLIIFVYICVNQKPNVLLWRQVTDKTLKAVE